MSANILKFPRRRSKKILRKHACTCIRRMLIKYSELDVRSGEITETREEWVTQPCGAPLFGDNERQRETCDACHSGWTDPHNYPVNSGVPTPPNNGPLTPDPDAG